MAEHRRCWFDVGGYASRERTVDAANVVCLISDSYSGETRMPNEFHCERLVSAGVLRYIQIKFFSLSL